MAEIAFSTVLIDGYAFEDGLALLAQCGIREVEPAFIEGYTPFTEDTFTAVAGRNLRRLLDREGLAARAVSAHTDLGRPDALDRLLRRIDFASGLGAGNIISNAAARCDERAFLNTVEAVLPHLQAARITLSIENPGHGSGALVPDGRSGAVIVRQFDSPFLRLNYDAGNAFTYSAGRIDLSADVAQALPVASRFHVKDVAVRGEDWHFCPVGRGIVAYAGALPPERRPLLPDLTVEHPIRLCRPNRGDPVRMTERATKEAIRDAVHENLEGLKTLGLL